jgi:Domain of unknown function (DUF4258)
MGKLSQIQALVRNGLYYLSEHADDEAIWENFDVYDVENGLLSGKFRRTWPRENKFEVVGKAMDGRKIGIVCRMTTGRKVRVITVFEDQPKGK